MKNILSTLMILTAISAYSQGRVLSYYEIKNGVEDKSWEAQKLKKAALPAPEKFDLKVKTSSSSQTASIYLNVDKPTQPQVEVFNMHGDKLQTLSEDTLVSGNHRFTYFPEEMQKPFIVTVRSSGKLQKMKVVKFNSF